MISLWNFKTMYILNSTEDLLYVFLFNATLSVCTSIVIFFDIFIIPNNFVIHLRLTI